MIKKYRGTGLFLLACLVATIVFYRDFVFHSGHMLYGTDMLSQAYQLRKFALDQLRSGAGFPLWNPYVYGGLPFLAILPGPVFYPTSLSYFLMPLGRAIGWTFVFHTFAAGAFAYAAARSLRLDRWAAAVVGFGFMFTGYMVSMLYGGHDGRMFALALFPLAFALTEYGFRTEKLRWFLALGVVLALQIFTPHVQLMYYCSLMLSLYALFRLVEIAREDRASGGGARGGAAKGGGAAGAKESEAKSEDAKSPRRVWRLAGYFAVAFVVAALIGGAQLIPTLRIMEFAVRGVPGQGGYEFAASWGLPGQEITAFLLPDLIGSLDTYWGANQFKLHTEYLGVVVVALSVFAITVRPRERLVWFLSGASILGVLFALGSATPVHKLAFTLIPQVKNFRAPSMMLGPASFFVALLAGLGWQSVLTARREGTPLPWVRIWIVAAPFLLAGLAAFLAPRGLLNWMLNGWFPAGWQRVPPDGILDPLRVNGAFVVGLWSFALLVGWMIVRKRVPVWATAPLILLLVVDLGRVDSRYVATVVEDEFFQPDQAITFMQARLGPGERVWPFRASYGPNELMSFGIPSVTGSQNFRLKWYDALVGGLANENLTRYPVLWPMFDISLLTSPQEVNVPLLTQIATGPRGPLYAMNEQRPHAWFPARLEATRDSAEALQRTIRIVDPSRLAIVEADEVPPAGEGSARVSVYGANEIELEVDATREGLLFVSEIYHPAWEAWIDEEPVEILRTNAAFRGVVVPQGSHTLRFRYSPAEFHGPLLISVLTLLIAVRLFGWGALRDWRADR